MFREILQELRANRWLMVQLFKRDFKGMYKQSFMGVLWAFIVPVASVGTIILLNRSGLFVIGELGVPYPVYAMLGLLVWQMFATGLMAGSNSLIRAGAMIAKINFSKKSMVIASFGQALIILAIQTAVVAALMLAYAVTPSSAAFLAPLLLLPAIFLSLGLAFIFSLLNAVVRDIGNLLSLLVTFLMFLTPVLYTPPRTGFLATITRYNPLHYLVAAPRELVLTGTVSQWPGFVLSAMLSLLICVLCLIVFHLTETRVAERI